MTRIPLTHKGWFGPVPVYTAGRYDGRTVYVARHWTLAPFMALTHVLFALALVVHAGRNPVASDDIPITLTGRLEPGRVVELPVAMG